MARIPNRCHGFTGTADAHGALDSFEQSYFVDLFAFHAAAAAGNGGEGVGCVDERTELGVDLNADFGGCGHRPNRLRARAVSSGSTMVASSQLAAAESSVWPS